MAGHLIIRFRHDAEIAFPGLEILRSAGQGRVALWCWIYDPCDLHIFVAQAVGAIPAQDLDAGHAGGRMCVLHGWVCCSVRCGWCGLK